MRGPYNGSRRHVECRIHSPPQAGSGDVLGQQITAMLAKWASGHLSPTTKRTPSSPTLAKPSAGSFTVSSTAANVAQPSRL
jgi:hypothetical protein